MKRLQIYLDEWLDDALAVEAARCGSSKAALIRAYVAEKLPGSGSARDGKTDIVGWIEEELPDVSEIDDVVYGRCGS